MSDQQQQMIRDAMKAIAERKPGKTKLVYDKTKRTIVAVAENSQTPRALNITADDADMFAVLTLAAAWFKTRWPALINGSTAVATVSRWDNGDAFTHTDLGPQAGADVVDCAIALSDAAASAVADIRVALDRTDDDLADGSTLIGPDGARFRLRGMVRHEGGHDEELHVTVAHVQPELSVRRAGLLETSVLSDRTILCVGLGTGGAHVAVELAKSGVGRFALVDPDRLSVGNVVRHPGPLSQVGRKKVNVVRDLIHEKNPDAAVSVHPIDASHESIEEIRGLVRQADVVVCGTDNRPSKLLLNRLALEAKVPALYGGAFRRAYGGQVLRVRPGTSPCHQCFIDAMPEQASDEEISSAAAADAVAYSDRPVAIEPGLSLDVTPIATFLAKLTLNELLIGKQSSFRALNRDYDAPWYLWLNRPEPGTPYADWPPLSESMDEMTINRWYGIYFDRDPACSACGDFIGATAAAFGLSLGSIELPALTSRRV